MASEALTGDLFVTAVAGALDGTSFAGTAAELLTLVTPDGDGWRPPKGWPATGRGVTQRLHRQAPVMRKAGWVVSDDGGENKQHATRWRISSPSLEVGRNPSSPSSPGSPSSPDSDETDTPARMARMASNDSDLPTGSCPHGKPYPPDPPGISTTGVAWCECCSNHFNGIARPGKLCKRCSTCTVCGSRLDSHLASLGDTTHPNCTGESGTI
jgi:hypothetical protein